MRARDRFIGWNAAQRAARLHLVVNNARFLILPWVHLRNLASRVLARISKRLPQDWQQRYGYRLLLLETFVQSDRFVGTSYRAANWISVGHTQGRGKPDVHHRRPLPKKEIWLYPLARDSAATSAPLSTLSLTSRPNAYVVEGLSLGRIMSYDHLCGEAIVVVQMRAISRII